jgi:leucine-zipper of insertion element IS481
VTLHRNAKTCPASRLLLCRRVIDEDWSPKDAAEAAGLSEPRAAAWLKRFREEDERASRIAPRRRGGYRTGPRR